MALALYRYSLPFRQPLMFKGQRLASREGLLVTINGQWGEIAPLPGFSRESLADATAESLACLAAIERGETATPTLPSVQFGFDCARHRWPASLPAPRPPYPLLQGTPQAQMSALPERVAQWQTAPPERIKLKVARYPSDAELALIASLARWLPNTRLILDANGGWQREQALRFCQQLSPTQIDYLEEPCATLADSIAVADATGIDIALDETLQRGTAWAPHPRLAALVIKPTLIGGFAACQALVQRARAHRLRVVISSSFESQWGLGQLSCLARQWAPEEPAGLDTAQAFSESLLSPAGELRPARLHCLYHAAAGDDCKELSP